MHRPLRTRLNSIKIKLSAAILLLFVTFMSVTVYMWYANSKSDAERQAGQAAAAMINVSSDNLETSLRDIDKIVALLSVDTGEYMNDLVRKYIEQYDTLDKVALIQAEREIQDYLINISMFKHYLTGVTLSDLSGHTIEYGVATPYEVLRSQPSFGELTSMTNEALLLPPRLNPRLGSSADPQKGKVITIARPIRSGGQAIGFVAADVDYAIVEDLFATNIRNAGNLLIFNRRTGQPVLDRPELGLAPADLARLASHLDADGGSFYTRLSTGSMFAVYRTSAFTNWTTMALIPKANLLAGSSSTRDKMLNVSLLFSAVAVLLILSMSSLLTRNLLRLGRALKEVAKNNLDVAIETKSQDEIGQLYHQFNSMTRRMSGLVAEVRSTERERSRAEMKALQAQINPHFLHNTLNTIKFLSILQGADNIKLVAESLSGLMHAQMDGRPFVSVDEELDCLRSYFSIQKFRYSDKFAVHIGPEEGVGKLMMPKMLLQPIAENALLHGIAPLKTQGTIQIKLFTSEAQLKIRVQDNGVGMTPAQLAALEAPVEPHGAAAHIGLANVRSRIRTLFGAPYGLSVWSEAQRFTTVEISLPILNEEEALRYV
ncbi:cache domain-containing sensor histidine kinase [Cohnella rhizosphaerae]|uniref:Histidine kinase n=1 Tax=Cohnella rhizosphaerae TaxID=1457232 RepID=A0A9X4QVI5_9BACL|nr:sensor histidine kinase [Cohnella rhizosphaerae]MDG0811527.1 histidine kinase [Cohnella rhizosphaerae]